MTRLRVVVLALAFAAAGAARAESPAASFARANEAFAAGHWDDAARRYEAIAQQDGVSAPLLFNLANAELRAGRIGLAILAYERAAWLAPGDQDIKANLHRARDFAGLPEPAAPWWQRPRSVLGPDGWSALVGLALLVGCAALLARLFAPRWRTAGTAIAAASGVLLVAGALACGSLWLDTRRGVVLEGGTPLRIAPFEAAEPRLTLTAGEVVRLVERHGDFVLARAADGTSGWMAAARVQPVVPDV
jgi:tetratricopeptide (TPR) repeat protein